jgi:RNA-binding protein 26
MLFTEQEQPLLKKWIVKRLENTCVQLNSSSKVLADLLTFSSDADADVLADYVLALLKHDGDTASVRALCEAEIPDFLKEDSAVFVQDVFDAIHYKSFLPGAPPPPLRRRSLPFAPPSGPSAHSYGNLGIGAQLGPLNGPRKRPYNDRGDGDAQDRGFQQGGDPNGRVYKQPRRGGGGMVVGNFDNFSNGRGGFAGGRPPPMDMQVMPPQNFQGMPGMPSPPPGMPPFDPNNPMAAMLAMQAMGFPVPGMPKFPQASSPVGQGPRGRPTQQRKQRCRDYDQKGFCARGNTCMFEHGEHSIWVPPANKGDEYDPSNSSLMTGVETNGIPAAPNFTSFRGSDRGRGRGAPRGDRGGGMSRRGGRSEFSSDRPNYDKNNTTIVVENIPEEKFSEEEVRVFFTEFGNILEVSMRPYKRLAIIKFEDWNGAKAAYSSPKVIFDNRFVKVYWFVDQESLPQPPASSMSNVASKNGSATSTPVPDREASEPRIDIEEFTRKQQEVQKAHEEKMKKKKEMEAQRKVIQERQEELLKSQAEEKRKLLERIAAKRGKSGTSPSGSETGTPAPGENKSVAQTEALKAQLAALEAEAQSLGIDTSLSDESSWGGRGRGRGRGGYRGRGAYVPRGFRGGYRGRGGAPLGGGGVYKLDNRPKTIGLSGIDFSEAQKNESLREYLLVSSPIAKLLIFY